MYRVLLCRRSSISKIPFPGCICGASGGHRIIRELDGAWGTTGCLVCRKTYGWPVICCDICCFGDRVAFEFVGSNERNRIGTCGYISCRRMLPCGCRSVSKIPLPGGYIA